MANNPAMLRALLAKLRQIDRKITTDRRVWLGLLIALLAGVAVSLRQAVGADWLVSGNDMLTLLPAARSTDLSDVLGWLTGPWIGHAIFIYYRPVTSLVLCAEYHLFGSQSAGWQIVSLSLHLASTAMLALLCRRLFGSGLAALVGAGAWGLGGWEKTIAWIPAQTDILAGFFALACLLSLAAYAGRPTRLLLLAAAISGLLAVGSKESALTLPLLATLLILHASALSQAAKGRIIGGIWALAGAFLLWRWRALGGFGFLPGQAHGHLAAAPISLLALSQTLFRFILPAPLVLTGAASGWASLALALTVVAIALLRRRKVRGLWQFAAGVAGLLLVTVLLGGVEWWLILPTYTGLLLGVACLFALAPAVIRRPRDSAFVAAWGICAWLPLYHIVWDDAGNVYYLPDSYWALVWALATVALLLPAGAPATASAQEQQHIPLPGKDVESRGRRTC